MSEDDEPSRATGDRIDAALSNLLAGPSPVNMVHGAITLGDGVLGSALRAEAIGTRLEVRLEDRLEHQLQRGLHDPIHGRRDPQRTDLPVRLGDRLLPHPLRNDHDAEDIMQEAIVRAFRFFDGFLVDALVFIEALDVGALRELGGRLKFSLFLQDGIDAGIGAGNGPLCHESPLGG